MEYDGQDTRRQHIRRHDSTAWVSLKDDGPTGQRGSDPSAYRVSIPGYYNIIQGTKPETTQKIWILVSSNAHITKSNQVKSTNKSTEAKIKLSCKNTASELQPSQSR